MICTANRNGASRTAYSTARLIITTASSSAACTALRTNRMPSAAITMSGARIQKAVMRGPLGIVSWRSEAGEARDFVGCSLGSRPLSGRRGRGVGPAVVVALVVAEPHRVRRLLHARQERRQEVGLLVDQVRAVVVGQLVLVGHRQRPGRARLDAQPAQDAAQVVDLVDAAVALTGAEALAVAVGVGGVAVGRTLDVDRVGRAGP